MSRIINQNNKTSTQSKLHQSGVDRLNKCLKSYYDHIQKEMQLDINQLLAKLEEDGYTQVHLIQRLSQTDLRTSYNLSIEEAIIIDREFNNRELPTYEQIQSIATQIQNGTKLASVEFASIPYNQIEQNSDIILVMGPSKCGKTAFITNCINYLLNISYDDYFRFSIVDKPQGQLLTIPVRVFNQNNLVTNYLFVECSLLEEIQYLEQLDENTTSNIPEFKLHQLFSTTLKKGAIKAVFFLNPESAVRLGPNEKHQLQRYFEILPKQYKDIIYLIITHSTFNKPDLAIYNLTGSPASKLHFSHPVEEDRSDNSVDEVKQVKQRRICYWYDNHCVFLKQVENDENQQVEARNLEEEKTSLKNKERIYWNINKKSLDQMFNGISISEHKQPGQQFQQRVYEMYEQQELIVKQMLLNQQIQQCPKLEQEQYHYQNAQYFNIQQVIGQDNNNTDIKARLHAKILYCKKCFQVCHKDCIMNITSNQENKCRRFRTPNNPNCTACAKHSKECSINDHVLQINIHADKKAMTGLIDNRNANSYLQEHHKERLLKCKVRQRQLDRFLKGQELHKNLEQIQRKIEMLEQSNSSSIIDFNMKIRQENLVNYIGQLKVSNQVSLPLVYLEKIYAQLIGDTSEAINLVDIQEPSVNMRNSCVQQQENDALLHRND